MYISIKKKKADQEMQLQKWNPAFLEITFSEIHLDICKTKGYSNILQKWYSDISKGQMKNLLSTHEVSLFVFKSYDTGTHLHLFVIVHCLSISSYTKRTKKYCVAVYSHWNLVYVLKVLKDLSGKYTVYG